MRLSKDKIRLKKKLKEQQHGQQQQQQQKIVDQEKRIKDSQNVLDTFLQEAVRLYEFIVDRLQEMLIEYVDTINDNNDGNAMREDENHSDDDNDDDSMIEDDDDINEFNRNYHSQSQQSSTSSKSKSESRTNNKKSKKKIKSSSSNDEHTKISMFIVPSLFRIYIHLGDLHRYSSSYNAAEKAYLKASNLAPGKGNPYNQLAVCNQINETSTTVSATGTGGGGNGNGSSSSSSTKSTGNPLPAVALYWYCRSLLASHEAFITSKSNLDRLFQANKKWIQESTELEGAGSGVKTFADVARSQNQDEKKNDNGSATAVATAADGKEDANKNEKKEQAFRMKKSLAKRKFLSKYVDFHGSLLSLLKKLEKGGTSGDGGSNNEDRKKKSSSGSSSISSSTKKADEMIKDLIHDMDNLVKEFESILGMSAFGDAFILRMICINAYSVWNSFEYLTEAMKKLEGVGSERSDGKGEVEGAVSLESSNTLTMTMLHPVIIALIFILRFGTVLCKDLVNLIEKGIAKYEKQKQEKKVFGSIRLLGPLFLLCEFISKECKLHDFSEKLASLVNDDDDLMDESTSTMKMSTLFDDTVQNFWRSVAVSANVIVGKESMVALVESDGVDSLTLLPDEFQSMLRGYIPFLSIGDNDDGDNNNNNNKETVNEDETAKEGNQVYLSPKEAYDVLELYQGQSQTQTQQSQQTLSSKKSSSIFGHDNRTPEKVEMEVRFKLKRFMMFVSKHIDKGDMVKNANGVVTILQDVESMDCSDHDGNDDIGMDIDDDENNFDNFEQNTQDESNELKDDVLVYTPAESGKPALLVPGAFLLGGEEDEEEDEDDEMDKHNDENVKESSFLSEVTMTEGLEESTSVSVPNLLDPSLLMERSGDVDTKKSPEKVVMQADIGESRLLGLVNKKLTSSSAPDLGVLPTPMTNNPAQKTPVRPPPGFNNTTQKPQGAAALPPMPPGLHSLPNDARNPLPPPQVHGFNHGFNHHEFPLPQTANPFVPQMGLNSNIGSTQELQLHSQNTLNGFHGSNTLNNTNAFSNFIAGNPVGMNSSRHDDSDDMNINYDVFGLHSLGIFTDDKKDAEQNKLNVDSLFQPMTETRNPFVFD